MKEKLTIDEALKMSWADVLRHYFGDIDQSTMDGIIWCETCYPFDNEKALDQIYEYYLKTENMKEPKNQEERKTLLVALYASYLQEMAEINDYAPNVEDIFYSEHSASWIMTFENGDDQEFETKEEAIAWIKAESTS